MTPVEAPIPCTSSPKAMAETVRSCLSPASVVRENEPMARKTTLRVGGSADVWVEPASEKDLSAVLARTRDLGLPVVVIGRGSNLLVRDGGIRGVVISLGQPHFSGLRVEGDRLRCGAGVRLKTLAQEARKHGLARLEFLEGIPGTVGGALRMNAGAHGGTTFDVVVSVRVMDFGGNVREMAGTNMQARYRSCPMLRENVAIEALFQGLPDDKACVDGRMKEFNRRRWASQPAAPSAGCMFKNPEATPAGQLVDELGLKGTRVGGAVVSQEHGNFIVTDGQATSADVLALIGQIKAEVHQRRGIELETEVEVIGEESASP